jgi:hypothetical protein
LHAEKKPLGGRAHFSFKRIVLTIEERYLVGILEYPDKDKYENQLILIVEIDE